MLFLEFHFKIKLYWPLKAQTGLPSVSSSSVFLPAWYLLSANGVGFGEDNSAGLIKDGSITQFFLFSFGKAVAVGERKQEKGKECTLFLALTIGRAVLGVFRILSFNPHPLVRCVLLILL